MENPVIGHDIYQIMGLEGIVRFHSFIHLLFIKHVILPLTIQ